MGRLVPTASAYLMVIAVTTGCSPCLFPGSDCDPPAPVVINGTEETITLFNVGGGDEAFLAELEPGARHGVHLTPALECKGGTLSARDPNGNEIASRVGLCRQEEWVVEYPRRLVSPPAWCQRCY
jgi:hypothetical protein